MKEAPNTKILSGRRLARVLLWGGVMLFLGAVLAVRAFAGMFSKYDDPARLDAEVYVTTTNGFIIRWVEKPAVNNNAPS